MPAMPSAGGRRDGRHTPATHISGQARRRRCQKLEMIKPKKLPYSPRIGVSVHAEGIKKFPVFDQTFYNLANILSHTRLGN